MRIFSGESSDHVDFSFESDGLEMLKIHRDLCQNCPSIGFRIKFFHGPVSSSAYCIEFSVQFYECVFVTWRGFVGIFEYFPICHFSITRLNEKQKKDAGKE